MASRALTDKNFSQNVFINCSFKEDYLTLLKPLLFTVLSCEFYPRIASERSDSGEVRIGKIRELIETSQFSIHDLSKIQAEHAGGYSRLNIPFEIGVDLACKYYKHKEKRSLVLEPERYIYQKILSDLSGCDVECHNNSPEEMVRIIRNWLGNFKKDKKIKGGSLI